MIRTALKILLFVASCCAIAAGGLYWAAHRPLAQPDGPVDFTIARGSSARAAANAIRASGIDVDPRLFAWIARLTDKARQLKAGSYEIARPVSTWQLLAKLTAGDVSLREMRLIEGWTFAQVRAAIDAQADLAHDSKGMSDSEILAAIGAAEAHPEGLFFPDTYLFDLQASDLDLYRRAYREMQQRLAAAWQARAEGLPLASPYEALILASIVEKETGRAEDRPMIAAVFVNRLQRGMRLQTDPTVIYGLGAQFDGNLRRRDLERDTPYNSYTRAGLPPTPIGMPGAASLAAALAPADARHLYFVARGDGSSEFSLTLREHNRAVARYQLGRGN
ncbi:MAG: endolytic transglycosylase MltG [Rhodocyclaceae bacterium]|nr:endolytic transglycosylase MltG [Rhodocyclaceae bacterium]